MTTKSKVQNSRDLCSSQSNNRQNQGLKETVRERAILPFQLVTPHPGVLLDPMRSFDDCSSSSSSSSNYIVTILY